MKAKFLWTATLVLAVMTLGAQVPQVLNYQGRIAVNGTNFTGTGQFKFALVDGGTNSTRAAAGTASVVDGFLVAVTVTDGGTGYASPPTITVTGGGGSGASFTVQISAGVVTNVIVNGAGSGYASTTTLTFSAPPTNLVAQTFWSNDGTSSSGGQPVASVPLPVTKGLYSVLLGDTTLTGMSAIPAAVFTNADVRLRAWFSDGTNSSQQLTPDQRLAAVAYAIMAGAVPDGSITASKIAPGAVGSSQLASNLTIPGTLTVSNLVVNGSPLSSAANLQIPSGTIIQTQTGGFYLITNASANIILPLTANVGDTLHLRIASGGPTYTIQQNPGQRIVGYNATTGTASLAACSADGTRLLIKAQTYSGQQCGFLFTTNSAVSWASSTLFGSMPSPLGIPAIQISSDGSHIFVGGDFANYQGILISQDYGQSWILSTNLPQIQNIQFIACSTNGTKLAVASGSGIYTSANSGLNWTLQTSAPTNAGWASVASSADGTKLVATSYSGIYTSANSGLNWTLQTSAPTDAGWASVASSADGTKLVATSYSGIYTSANSGLSWTLQTNAPTNAQWTSVASSADGTKLVATSYSGIYTSANSGLNWTLQTSAPTNASWALVASSADGTKLVAGAEGNGNIYTSADSGNTWAPVTSFPAFPIQTLDAVSSVGTQGGATFNNLDNNELILVYLGNGQFAIGDYNMDNLNGY